VAPLAVVALVTNLALPPFLLLVAAVRALALLAAGC
jgi:hypothetical protein